MVSTGPGHLLQTLQRKPPSAQKGELTRLRLWVDNVPAAPHCSLLTAARLWSRCEGRPCHPESELAGMGPGSCRNNYTLNQCGTSRQPQSRQHWLPCVKDLWGGMKYHCRGARTAAMLQHSLVRSFHSLPPSFLFQETRQNTISGVAIHEGSMSGDMECPSRRPGHTTA